MFDTFRSRMKTWFTIGAGTIAAILVAGMLGAFGALEEPEIPSFDSGEPIETGQWIVVPLRAFVVTDQRIFGMPVTEGTRALVVEAEMTNRTASSTGDYHSLITLDPAISADKASFVALTRDPHLTPELHPGMTERIAYIWMVPDTVDLPDRLPLTIRSKIYKPIDNLYGTPGWFNEHVLGRVTVPVETETAS
ncbi:hypothetical protein [Aquamicrobium sp. LC103]|uniref:hypothetical protein n=1 Tax=Aquamicrobium sp. LC103 TaxID=1120658 RepID=UPI00063EB1F5|nr:hypothetical protein [Aquamicrobium sp. LC103]TKT69695.1 hypothetical protein XW59_026530 [Aquamicrobium sp. LC103]